MGYIEVPIDSEPVDVAEEAFGYIEAQVPGWLPHDGNLETWLVEALAQMAGELRSLVALVPDSIFQYLGASILGLPPYPAVQATGSTTWTMIDAAGYTVTSGTLIAITPPSQSESFAFQVVDDFTLPAGSQTQTSVAVRALEAGAAASGISGTVEMLDPLDFVDTITLDSPTSGGSDAEASDAYLRRLSDLLTLLAPRPILAPDFAVMARTHPSVARATAIDLYNADTQQTNVPRCVTVTVVDADGNALSAATMADVRSLLQAEREVNFLVFVIAPTYTTIDVTVDVSCFPGYNAQDVAARVKTQLQSYLSPAQWGVPPFGDTSTRSWINDTHVRYLEVAEQVNRVEGVHFIRALAIGENGGTQGTADLVMASVAPLPRAGVIVATGIAEA